MSRVVVHAASIWTLAERDVSQPSRRASTAGSRVAGCVAAWCVLSFTYGYPSPSCAL